MNTNTDRLKRRAAQTLVAHAKRAAGAETTEPAPGEKRDAFPFTLGGHSPERCERVWNEQFDRLFAVMKPDYKARYLAQCRQIEELREPDGPLFPEGSMLKILADGDTFIPVLTDGLLARVSRVLDGELSPDAPLDRAEWLDCPNMDVPGDPH